MDNPGRADWSARDPGRELLDVVGDGGAVRLHLDLGPPPIAGPAEPVALVQLGVGGLGPAAAAAQAAPGLARGQVGADALGQPAVVRAREGAGGRSAAALRLERAR